MNMRTYLVRLLCLSLCLTFFAPTAVLAGADKQLVEVDTAERERLEKERIEMQEAYKEEVKKQDDSKAEEERMSKAQEIRDKEIEERDQYFESSEGEDVESVAQCPPRKCFFFCWLWKVVSFPFKLIAMPFKS